VEFHHPTQAHLAGLSTVFQEFNLLPDRTVAENIYLGREPRKGLLVDTKAMNSRTAELFDQLGIGNIRPTAAVSSLSVAQQQIVEIAKAVSYDARIISMDEPTAALAGPRSISFTRSSAGSRSAARQSFTSRTGSRRSSTSATRSPS
jgi:ribose transport system ATP-binding protein